MCMHRRVGERAARMEVGCRVATATAARNKGASCLRCISYRGGCCKRQLCGENADFSLKRRLLIKLMSGAEARDVVVPQFDVALTQHDRMRDGCGPHAPDVISHAVQVIGGTPSDLIRDLGEDYSAAGHWPKYFGGVLPRITWLLHQVLGY